MRILLIGEYSGAFTGLCKLFREKGHEVFFIHEGDGYKNFSGADASIKYTKRNYKNRFLDRFSRIVYIINTITGTRGIIQLRKYDEFLKSLKDFDVVLLINTKFLNEFGTFANIYAFNILKENNKNIYLCALGDDYVWVKNCLEKKVPYSMFDRMNFNNFAKFTSSLLYVYGFGAKILDNTIKNSVKTTIPGLFDYYYAYKNQNRECSGIVPLLVNSTKVNPILDIHYPIVIFHGKQPGKSLRKGNDIFDKAILKILENYPDKVKYISKGGISYDEYVNSFDECHIFIDQCFSLDQGMNGLLGMAKGKVVFSGFHDHFVDYLGLTREEARKILIHSPPSEEAIYREVEEIILNPNKILEISANAIEYINSYHNKDKIYNSYMNIFFNEK